jgi:hypothetical protein
MKEELLKVLETKLDSINKNIESLDLINTRLNGEEENLNYVQQILGYFKNEEDGYDINRFSLLDKENFNKCLELVPDSTKGKFQTNSCNYDGLVYLINGINNGIALTLTEEQQQAIELMINGLSDKKIDYQARIDGIKLARDRLEVSDLNALELSKEKYQSIVNELNNNDYISETDDVINAINYSNVEQNKVVDMLSYLLKYNADIYSERVEKGLQNPTYVANEEVEQVVPTEEVYEAPVETDMEMPVDVPTEKVYENPQEMDFMPTEDYEEVSAEETEIPQEEPVPLEVYQETEVPADVPVDNTEVETPIETAVSEEVQEEINKLVTEEEPEEYQNSELEITPAPLEVEAHSDMINKDELDSLLQGYHIKLDDEFDDSLLYGDINNYRDILDNLRNQDVLPTISKNQILLKNILIYSNNELIDNVLEIIRNDFSIDDDDYVETAKITIDTLPAIFVNEPIGTYDNFIRNVEMFKRLNFDMINLFDFSRELLVVDNNLLESNYQLVSRYDINIDEKNAKYLLAIPNVVERMDYYVESLYDDKITRKTFDGINIIRMYPSKLDTVTDLTIKRLRYSSENGKKMFGSRENSISGEVANLKVDVLNIPDNYMASFFNNEFDDITGEEITSFEQMLLANNNYQFVEDELLQKLNMYRDGLRYSIENVNVSYNKVLRNYNILINNNIDPQKALEFAVCYNLVITKDEYIKVKNVLNTLGGK